MDVSYQDFGSESSDSEDDMNGIGTALDSDEEEKYENDTLMKILSLPTASKKAREIDDFEAEMEAELDKRALEVESEGGMEHQRSLSRSSSTSSLNTSSRPTSSLSRHEQGTSSLKVDKKSTKKKSVKFAEEPPPPGTSSESNEDVPKTLYDAIYFDSDESEGENDQDKAQKQKKRTFVSNEDLFYDPDSDAKDQAWVDSRRRKYCPDTSSTPRSDGATTTSVTSAKDSDSSLLQPKSKKTKTPLPSTDAVLNCPACFTALCLDCQRHEFYSGQYRAMFVMNCRVDKTETLVVPVKEPKGRRGKGKAKVEPQASNSEADKFFPVKCKICTTQVAVYDNDEVYHFFNVLASHP